MAGYVSPFPFNPEILDPALASIEKTFDDWGWIPVVGTLPGMLRQFLGLVELVSAVAAVAFNIVRGLFIEDGEEKRELLGVSQFLVDNYATHGIANVVRGQIESIPLVNLIFYLYNKNPQIRMQYRCESPLLSGQETPLSHRHCSRCSSRRRSSAGFWKS